MTIRAVLATAALALACLVTGAGTAAADDWYNHTVDIMPIQMCMGDNCGFPTAD
ncbi:hypothetical protein ACFV8E_20230 [Streptomyces sp. NPDC059849]|uniref:hypothetical protein n=1 Tax=unclassified Streptomyces TaxID=2593676 RepID=UPI003668BFCF